MSHTNTAQGAHFLAGCKRIVVAGLGRSGRAAGALAGRCGVPITVVDTRPEAQLEAALHALPDGTRFIPEAEAGDVLATATLVILSPGIDPRRDPYRGAIASTGTIVMSEIELGWRFVESPVVAVTGSNGKSTVTSMTAKLLAAAGFDARACGNIGQPLCDALEEQMADTRLIVEVSSFQLERTIDFAPDVAVLLNVTPDHQDRYDDLEAYAAAKSNVFAGQNADDVAIICADDPVASGLAERVATRHAGDDGPAVLLYGDGSPSSVTDHAAGIEDGVLTVRLWAENHVVGRVNDLPLPGPHNRLNTLAAAAAALCAGAAPERVEAAVPSLGALPHRLETVATHDGVRFVNDSKATNIASAVMALRSFPAGSVHAILGGRDKGADFEALAATLREHARAVYAIGEAGPRIATILGPVLSDVVKVQAMEDLATAFAAATATAGSGETVLLAPACASFDAYENFEARGEHFRTLTQHHVREA